MKLFFECLHAEKFKKITFFKKKYRKEKIFKIEKYKIIKFIIGDHGSLLNFLLKDN